MSTYIQPPLEFLLPESTWTPPQEFPDLIGRGAKHITLDVESRDPHLQERGPGFIRRDAFVAGVAVGAEGYRQYFPVRHAQGGNLAPNVVFEWLDDQMKAMDQSHELYGANILYDLEGLHFEKVRCPNARIRDVQTIEALIDEETAEGYSLEVLAKKYLGEGKDEELLRDAAKVHRTAPIKGKKKYGVQFNAKKDLWMLPPEFVGAYAESDIDRPERIYKRQYDILVSEGLQRPLDIETRLVPLLLNMRLTGVRVDLEKAEAAAKRLDKEVDAVSYAIKDLVGWDMNVDSAPELIRAYEHLKLPMPGYTKANNPSFAKDLLLKEENPFARMILEKRKLMDMRDKFIRKDIIASSVNGRVHCQMNSLRQDDSGTRTGRFSSTNPNLQQVPKRDKVWGPIIRGLFIADEGKLFFKGDFASQEPRLLVHYAGLCKLPGAMEAVEAYRRNPKTDYHVLTRDIINRITGKNFERGSVKEINLGKMYNMGKAKLARRLGVSESEAEDIINGYEMALPFVRGLQNLCTKKAEKDGAIRTILDYKRRFNLWVPFRSKATGLPYEKAVNRWPGERLVRFGTHKATNALIQGSAAYQTKRAMVMVYEEHNLLPCLQVHDELCGPAEDIEEAKKYKYCMEHAVELIIPVVCDGGVGPNWGDAKIPVAA